MSSPVGRHDIEDDGCPVRVVKWGLGGKVTLKIRAGHVVHSPAVGFDGFGDPMVQFEIEGDSEVGTALSEPYDFE